MTRKHSNVNQPPIVKGMLIENALPQVPKSEPTKRGHDQQRLQTPATGSERNKALTVGRRVGQSVRGVVR